MYDNIKNKAKSSLNELFTLLIELGNNESQYLKVYEDSVPEKLAYNFCLEHNLDFTSLQSLTKEIKRTLYKTKEKERMNNSFEIPNKSPLKNATQIKDSNSLKNIHSINITDKNGPNSDINKLKYNFKDISKSLKRPIIYQFKIIIKDENIPNKKVKSKNVKKYEKNMYFVGNKSNLTKDDNNDKKERIKRSYLSPTESSSSKVKKNREKNDIKDDKKDKGTKTHSNNNIKIINIINNNITNSVNHLDINNKNSYAKKNKEINYGEILYQKGIKLKEISKKKTENKVNEELKEEKKIYTFKPKINPVNIKSIKFIKNKKSLSHTNIEKIEDVKDENNKVNEYSKNKKEEKNRKRIIYNSKNKQKIKEKLKKDNNDDNKTMASNKNNISNKEEQKLKNKIEQKNNNINYTNKETKEKNKNITKNNENKNKKIQNENNIPSTSKANFELRGRPASEKPKKSKHKIMTIYEKLYTQRNNLQLLENKIYNKDELFKPKTNSNYKGLYNNKPFSQRQVIYKAKSAERKKKLNQQTYPKYDLKTGQKLFQPLINKSYNSSHTSLNLNLYLNARSGKMKREELQKRLYINKKFKDFRANEKSENLFENQILKSFKKIFLILDKNQNGKLSQFNYNIKELPDNIKKIIYPILNKIDIKDKILNEDNFIYECKKLYKTLNYYDKKEIYNFSENYDQKKTIFIPSYSLEDNFEKNKYSYYCLTNSDKNTYDNNISSSYYRLKSSTYSNNKDKFSRSSNYDINDYYINTNNYLNLNGNNSNYRTFYGNSFEARKRKYFDNLVIQRLQEEILDFQL